MPKRELPKRDRPLTASQERVLIALFDRDDDRPGNWHRLRLLPGGYMPGTVHVLSEYGLIEVRYPGGRDGWEGRITQDGRNLCASMGD